MVSEPWGYAALSYDEGKTWPIKKLLTDGNERFLNGGAWSGFFTMDATYTDPGDIRSAHSRPTVSSIS